MTQQPTANLPIFQQIFSQHVFEQALWQSFKNFLLQFGAQIPARVETVHSNGAGETGTVDLLPLLSLQTEEGQKIPQTLLYNVPYFRLQGGANAVILDPQPGDIGQLILNGRDVSGVKNQQKTALPPSKRLFSQNDCFFLPSLFGQAAKQYLMANQEGWQLHAAKGASILIEADKIELAGNVTVKGTLSVSGDITAGEKQISLQNHTHPFNIANTETGAPA